MTMVAVCFSLYSIVDRYKQFSMAVYDVVAVYNILQLYINLEISKKI